MDVIKPSELREFLSGRKGQNVYLYTGQAGYAFTVPDDVDSIFKTRGLEIGNKFFAFDKITALSDTVIPWLGGGGGGGATSLGALSDVTLTSPSDLQILQYEQSSGQWKNTPPPFEPSGTVADHAALSDVHHSRQHALSSVSDHTGSITPAQHGDLSGSAAAHHTWVSITGKPTSFNPDAHVSTHQRGGGDSIALDEVEDPSTPEQNVSLDSNINRHGLCPRLSGNSGQFLDGTGGWATPSGGGDVLGPAANSDNYIPQWDGADSNKLKNGIDPTTLTTQTDLSTHTANADAHHAHANKTELDLVTDGDHDVRTDNPHGVSTAQIGAEPSFTKNTAFNKDFGSLSDTVCEGDDSRLSDARTPSSHASTHDGNGADTIATADATKSGLCPQLSGNSSQFLSGIGTWSAPSGGGDVLGPAANTDDYIPQWNGNDTKTLKNGINPAAVERTINKNSANGYPGLDGSLKLDGTQQVYGSSTNTACEGNDSRLSDARTPTSHASSHQNGGGDEIAITTPTANAIPKADASGELVSGWIPDGADASAIHDNTANEISALTEKATLVSADILLIEDSEALFVKKKVQIGSLPGGSGLPDGYINNLALSRPTAATVSIGAGKCRDDADADDISVSTPITVNLTASGANGLDSGTESASTWYAVWLCKGASGVCGLFSTSGTSPTLPSGYDQSKRRVGWTRNNSASDLIDFIQSGVQNEREYVYNAGRSDLAVVENARAVSTGWVTVGSDTDPDIVIQQAVGNLAPPTSKFVLLSYRRTGTGGEHFLRPKNLTSDDPSTSEFAGLITIRNTDGDAAMMFPLDSNRDLEYYSTSNVTSKNGLYLWILGFKDYV